MKTRKTVKMLVEVSVPVGRSAAFARREVRELINNGAGYFTYAGEEVKVRSVKGVRA